jgi:hypothetical protein
MERDTSFLRPKDPGKCEMSRLDFKIMYPIETEHLSIPFGEFNTKQLLHEQTNPHTRVVTKISSEDVITVAIGNRKNNYYTRVYSFYKNLEEEAEVTQENWIPLADDCQEPEEQKLLNIELEIKKEPLKVLSSNFFDNYFYLFHFYVLAKFLNQFSTLVKIKMFDKAKIFRKYVNDKKNF